MAAINLAQAKELLQQTDAQKAALENTQNLNIPQRHFGSPITAKYQQEIVDYNTSLQQTKDQNLPVLQNQSNQLKTYISSETEYELRQQAIHDVEAFADKGILAAVYGFHADSNPYFNEYARAQMKGELIAKQDQLNYLEHQQSLLNSTLPKGETANFNITYVPNPKNPDLSMPTIKGISINSDFFKQSFPTVQAYNDAITKYNLNISTTPAERAASMSTQGIQQQNIQKQQTVLASLQSTQEYQSQQRLENLSIGAAQAVGNVVPLLYTPTKFVTATALGFEETGINFVQESVRVLSNNKVFGVDTNTKKQIDAEFDKQVNEQRQTIFEGYKSKNFIQKLKAVSGTLLFPAVSKTLLGSFTRKPDFLLTDKYVQQLNELQGNVITTDSLNDIVIAGAISFGEALLFASSFGAAEKAALLARTAILSRLAVDETELGIQAELKTLAAKTYDLATIPVNAASKIIQYGFYAQIGSQILEVPNQLLKGNIAQAEISASQVAGLLAGFKAGNYLVENFPIGYGSIKSVGQDPVGLQDGLRKDIALAAMKDTSAYVGGSTAIEAKFGVGLFREGKDIELYTKEPKDVEKATAAIEKVLKEKGIDYNLERMPSPDGISSGHNVFEDLEGNNIAEVVLRGEDAAKADEILDIDGIRFRNPDQVIEDKYQILRSIEKGEKMPEDKVTKTKNDIELIEKAIKEVTIPKTIYKGFYLKLGEDNVKLLLGLGKVKTGDVISNKIIFGSRGLNELEGLKDISFNFNKDMKLELTPEFGSGNIASYPAFAFETEFFRKTAGTIFKDSVTAKEDIANLERLIEVRKILRNQKSAFIGDLPKLTKILTPEETKFTIEFLKNHKKDFDRIYGSFTDTAQTRTDLKREVNDIEIQFKKDSDAESFGLKFEKEASLAGFKDLKFKIEKAKVKPETEEVETGFNDLSVKAKKELRDVDNRLPSKKLKDALSFKKEREFAVGDMGIYKGAEKAIELKSHEQEEQELIGSRGYRYGYKEERPNIKIEGITAQTQFEQLVRKSGTSQTFFKEIQETNKMVNILEAPAHRAKDIPDVYREIVSLADSRRILRNEQSEVQKGLKKNTLKPKIEKVQTEADRAEQIAEEYRKSYETIPEGISKERAAFRKEVIDLFKEIDKTQIRKIDITEQIKSSRPKGREKSQFSIINSEYSKYAKMFSSSSSASAKSSKSVSSSVSPYKNPSVSPYKSISPSVSPYKSISPSVSPYKSISPSVSPSASPSPYLSPSPYPPIEDSSAGFFLLGGKQRKLHNKKKGKKRAKDNTFYTPDLTSIALDIRTNVKAKNLDKFIKSRSDIRPLIRVIK